MCGIAGIHYKIPVDGAVLDHAVDHFGVGLRHRGPDDFGVHRSPRAAYINCRLSIVDREGGRQPIFDATGQRGIVYNGEVYHHGELRAQLQAGHAFRTQTDTEVVLAAVLAQGSEGLARLNGMFGLCIWNDADGSFLLARDRFGMKPLYVYEDDRCIAFASEMRTLLGLPGLSHELDEVGFQDLLAYRYNLAPHTLFRHIRKLPAGHWLRFDGQSSQTARFADLAITPEDDDRDEGERLEQLDGLLTRAVRSRLMGEVPIGLLLSGGLDSSAIAAYLQRAGARLKAYSIGFPEVNEFAYSRAVAQRFGLDYTEVTLTQEELRAGMDTVLHQLDEPLADPACFALSRLCSDIRRDINVVLSGEGCDELFAGYGHHQLALQAGLEGDAAFAQFFVRSASNLDANDWLRHKSLPLHHLRWRQSFDRAPSLLAGMQQFELHTWLPENLMMKADKILMAHSLQGRFPFLDLPLFEFAAALPQALKLPHAQDSSHLLRQLLKPQLPDTFLDRHKMGFTVPPAFFLQSLRSRLREAVATLRQSPVAEVLDLDRIDALFGRTYRGEPVPVIKAWNLAVLLLWWTDVYPVAARGTPARPAPAPAVIAKAEAPRTRLVVFTALVGAKETLANPLELLEPGATSDLDLDFVCITDQPQLASPVWRMQPIGDRHLMSEKLSRRPKAMPHLYFPDVGHSLYIDNTVRFKRLPQAADLATGQPYLFRAFRHSKRQHPGEEIENRWDDVSRQSRGSTTRSSRWTTMSSPSSSDFWPATRATSVWDKRDNPRATSCPSGLTIETASPAAKLPRTPSTPTARMLRFFAQIASAAPRSSKITPRGRSVNAIQCFRALRRWCTAGKNVPTSSPEMTRPKIPGSRA